MTGAVQPEATGAAAPGTMLERIFGDGRLVRDEHQVDGARNMLQGFIEEATKAGGKAAGTAKRALAERLVALDQLITKQVNAVLHTERFQKLEASWRNLNKLVSENELSSSMKVRVFNCHRRELERDFSRAPGFDQSLFFKHVYESEYGTLGGSPFTFLVGDMEFGRSPRDIQFLRDVAAVASMAHAPFLAGASPDLLDLDGFTELDRPIDIAKIFETSEMVSWNSLRDSGDSRYLALTAPRVLVRLPWGPDSAPVEAIDFEEDVDGADYGKYLWGPSSWALAGQIMKSFAQHGWPSAIRGTETGGKVANLPLHSFPSLAETNITKCPTETTITDRREKELSDQGIIGLCHARNTDYALTVPRVLVRLPWGPDSAPVEAIDFAEDVDGADYGKYLWGPSSWALAGQIMKSFAQHGWPSAIRGTETGGKVENLPLHSFPSLAETNITKCPTETTITDRREKELSDQGIIGLCHARNTDYAVIFSGSTVNRPRRYVEDEANANARLSASLPYILACARFAHYLKAIMRDKIGGFTNREAVERHLSNWIAQYVTSDDGASHGTKARFPLREARIQVRDIPGKPGAHTVVAHLRPHFQLEELTASLRLVAELPTAGGG